jgi:hypothetical protein
MPENIGINLFEINVNLLGINVNLLGINVNTQGTIHVLHTQYLGVSDPLSPL